jgi:hypothetical protein
LHEGMVVDEVVDSLVLDEGEDAITEVACRNIREELDEEGGFHPSLLLILPVLFDMLLLILPVLFGIIIVLVLVLV